MKYLHFLMFFCITITNSNGQLITNEQDSGLTKEEFQQAKDKYLQMVKSKEYVELDKLQTLIAKKLNGNSIMSSDDAIKWSSQSENKAEENFKKHIRQWLNNNIEKTDFSSVEGFNMICKSFEITDVMMKKNKDLYDMIARANRRQVSEILQPEHENRYDKLFEHSN